MTLPLTVATEPIRDVTCGRCGRDDAVIYPVPPPRGTCACPGCSGAAAIAALERATDLYRAEVRA